MQSGPFTTYVAFRLLICGVFMLSMHFLKKEKETKLEFLDCVLLFQGAFFGLYVCYLGCFWSMQYVMVGKVYFLFLLTPFFTALFSRLYGAEVLSYKKLLSLGIGIIGFIPIILAEGAAEEGFKSFYAFNLPEVILILSVAAYAYSWIIVKRLMVERKHSLWTVNGITMTGASIVTFITAFFYDGWYKGMHPVTDWNPFIGYTVLVAFTSIFCFILHSTLLKKYSTTLIAFFCFIEPFMASIYAYFILKEPISWSLIPSLFIVSIGLYIFYQDELAAG